MQQSYANTLASVDNTQLTIAQYEQNIFDLQQQLKGENVFFCNFFQHDYNIRGKPMHKTLLKFYC